MRTDLEGLKISDEELKQLSGIDELNRLNMNNIEIKKIPDHKSVVIRPSVQSYETLHAVNKKVKEKIKNTRIGCLIMPILVSSIIFFIVEREQSLITFLSVMFIIYYFVIRNINKEMKKKVDELPNLTPTYIGILLDEVDKYNTVVTELTSRIDAIDQLAEIGYNVKVKNREIIINSIKNIREKLITALKTEKILRDRNLTLENFTNFSNDFIPFEALNIDGQIKDIDNAFDDFMLTNLKVQEEMKEIYLQIKNK